MRQELYDAILQMRKDSAEMRTTLAEQAKELALANIKLDAALKTMNGHDITLYGPEHNGGLVAAVRDHDKLAQEVDRIKATAGRALLAGVGSFFAMGARWFAEHLSIK